MVISVDFDGTLCEHKYPAIGDENPVLITALKALKERGHKLILWTCRDKKELDEAVEWCKGKGLEFDAVNANIEGHGYTNLSCKIVADVYIDDRALHPYLFLKQGGWIK